MAMPSIVPEIDPETIPNSGERAVYKALSAQLPDNWAVRHHYPACWLHGMFMSECESDFIVLAPGKGILFLEVKGSYGYDSKDGIWHRIDKMGKRVVVKPSPWDQVQRTKHTIVEKLSAKLGYGDKYNFPGIYGHMVIFPLAKKAGKLPDSIDPALILSHKDMGTLGARLEHAFDLWDKVSRGPSFTPQVMEEVFNFLKDDCRFIPVISSEVDEDEQVIEELTKQQYQGFQKLMQSSRLLVKGTAGSGKTMIAFWAAKALAAQGQEVLFLCFNSQLAEWLKLQNPPGTQLVIHNFHAYCSEVAKLKGIRLDKPAGMDDKEFWQKRAPDLCAKACGGMTLEEKYDAVFVDEAQDFHEDWWWPVELSLKDQDNGRLHVFWDPDQRIYGRGEQYPAGMKPHELEENCRNTKRIVEYCSRVIDTTIETFELSPDGIAPEVLDPIGDAGKRAQAAGRLAANLLSEGFAPSRVAILSPFATSNNACSLRYLDQVDDIPVKTGKESIEKWLNDELILGSTIKSFKGMEVDCLIVTDLPPASEHFFEVADLYIAVSRAKHRIALIPSHKNAAAQLKNWLKKNPS